MYSLIRSDLEERKNGIKHSPNVNGVIKRQIIIMIFMMIIMMVLAVLLLAALIWGLENKNKR